MRTIRTASTAALLIMLPAGLSAAQDSVKLLDNSALYEAEATFRDAYRTDDGQPIDLNLKFFTDADGAVSKPTLDFVTNGNAVSTAGYCEPVCVTYGNPKKTRCFIPCPTGPNPVLNIPSVLLDEPLIFEFAGTSDAMADSLTMNVELWKDGDETATAQSIGVLDFAKVRGINE